MCRTYNALSVWAFNNSLNDTGTGSLDNGLIADGPISYVVNDLNGYALTLPSGSQLTFTNGLYTGATTYPWELRYRFKASSGISNIYLLRRGNMLTSGDKFAYIDSSGHLNYNFGTGINTYTTKNLRDGSWHEVVFCVNQRRSTGGTIFIHSIIDNDAHTSTNNSTTADSASSLTIGSNEVSSEEITYDFITYKQPQIVT